MSISEKIDWIRNPTFAASKLISRQFIPYWFLLPFFVIFGVFYVWPIAWAPWMSLHEFTFAGTEFIGLEHYGDLATGSQLLTTLKNTFFIAGIVVPIQVIGGLAIAVVIDSGYVRFRRVVRSGYLIPLVTSTTVLAIIFDLFLTRTGLLNLFLQATLGTEVLWLTRPFPAKVSVASVVAWRQMGISVLVYLAGLQGIPKDLYRAAKVDGANRLQQFWHITVPQLRPITILVVILNTSFALRLFTVPYVLTDGGPGNASKTIVQFMYTVAFQELALGKAAAIGTVLTVLLSTIMILQYRLGGENNGN